MPYPESPITTLAKALQATDALRGNAAVYTGRKDFSRVGAPPRIILMPHEGADLPPADKDNSLGDIDMGIAVRIWGETIDAVWWLHVWFVQALEEQGAAGGLWWELGPTIWNEAPDTSSQGECETFQIRVRLAIPSAAGDEGHVGDAWTQGEVDETDIEPAPST